MSVKHDWPRDGEYRRYHFNNPRRTVANGESYLHDFTLWLTEELQGLLLDVVAAERIELRPSQKAQTDYNMPEVIPRWHVCIEVDEFPYVPAEVETTVTRLLHFLGLKNTPPAIEPLRVLRYYSFSPRQYDRFLELMGTEK